MVTFNDSLLDYIKGHRNAILATNRKAGPPQLTLISYYYNGKDFAISTRGESQKAKNLGRRPDAALAIVDGGQQLIVYGKVDVISDPAEVVRINKERMNSRGESDTELRERLEREGRVVLILTPERYFPERLRAP
jgi:PPOX class probable F420-dependent enzyme